jgi:hypothetical protein
VDVDPVVAQALLEERAGFRVELREETLVRLDDPDGRPHAREELRELDAHRPAAEHDKALGNAVAQTASRLVQYSTSANPSIGGTAGDEPVATTSASYSSSRSPTTTSPRRATRASPRTSSAR